MLLPHSPAGTGNKAAASATEASASAMAAEGHEVCGSPHAALSVCESAAVQRCAIASDVKGMQQLQQWSPHPGGYCVAQQAA